MLVHVLPPSVENSHLITLPVLPERVRVPLLAPLHTVAVPEVVPPTDVGDTVTVAVEEYTLAQDPL